MQNPPSLPPGETAVILAALQFTVQKELRKMNPDKGNAITCRIVVTEILSRVGHVDDITTLTAAILHHVFDSSASITHELDLHFGREIRLLVEELAGNKHLSHTEQMQDLLDRAPYFSVRAKQIVIAEKICKLQEMAKAHTTGWSAEQRRGYLTWMGQLVEICRGANPYLEAHFDELYEEQCQAILHLED